MYLRKYGNDVVHDFCEGIWDGEEYGGPDGGLIENV